MTPDAVDQHDTRIARQPLQALGDILVAPEFQTALAAIGLTSFNAIFTFDRGKDLAKRNIGAHRKRLQLEVTIAGEDRPTKLYLKRYDRPPRLQQLIHWLALGRHVSLGRAEHDTACRLGAAGRHDVVLDDRAEGPRQSLQAVIH